MAALFFYGDEIFFEIDSEEEKTNDEVMKKKKGSDPRLLPF